MRRWIVLVGSVVLACSDPTSVARAPEDALAMEVAADVAAYDASGETGDQDLPVVSDAPTDKGPPQDAGPGCGDIPVRDLNREGTLRGDYLSLVGDANAAPEVARPTPCSAGQATHVAAFRYTLGRTARLEVELDGVDGAPIGADLVAWLQSACDDAGSALLPRCAIGSTREIQYQTTETRIDAGTTVFVFVGTESDPARPVRYRLTVHEVQPVIPVGGACTPSSECVAGADCTSRMTCQARGAAGGRCRTGATPACDMGLGCDTLRECAPLLGLGAFCNVEAPLCGEGLVCQRSDGRCVAAGALGAPCLPATAPVRCAAGLVCSDGLCAATIAPGMACAPGHTPDLCAPGSACDRVGGTNVCVAEGERLGPCRTAAGALPCNAGLSCVTGFCASVAAAGADCSGFTVCTTGFDCVRSGGASRCMASGSNGTPCRMTSPPCMANLGCARFRCVPEVPVDGACDDTLAANVCVATATCRGRVCVADGALGARCRASEPRCNAGLGCDSGGTCRMQVAEGASCDFEVVCPAGDSCVRSSAGAGRCVRDGVQGGYCRMTAPECNAGLVCRDDRGGCQHVGAPGDVCDFGFNVCAANARCFSGRCVAEGALNGSCRTGAGVRPCDAGLGCLTGAFGGTCVTELAADAACDSRSTNTICVAGAPCLSFNGGEERCRADGTLIGHCRADRSCNAGLTCLPDGNVCVRPLAPGESCDVDLTTPVVCASRSLCLPRRGGQYCVAAGSPGAPCLATSPVCAAGSTCLGSGLCSVPAGSDGGACRTSGAPCDASLACTVSFGVSRCRFAVLEGAACDQYGVLNACVAGTTCSLSGSTHRCQR